MPRSRARLCIRICNFSNARTSICRMRSRLTLYCDTQVFERERLIPQATLGQNILFAFVQRSHCFAQQGAPCLKLV